MMERKPIMKINKILFVAPVVAVFIALSAPSARATTYALSIDHCTGGCTPGTSNVSTVQGAGFVDVTVTLGANLLFVTSGAGGGNVFGFNLVGAAPTSVTLITVPGGVPALAFRSGTPWGDGFGNFEHAIWCPTCQNGAGDAFAGPLTFRVNRAGITLADFEELSTGGAPSVFFAADVYSVAGAGTGNTGLIGGPGTPTQTPEPATLTLLGLGLFGVAATLRRKRAQ